MNELSRKCSGERIYQRYKGLKPYETLLSKLLEDIKVLSEKYTLKPSLVVITGDLTEPSRPSE